MKSKELTAAIELLNSEDRVLNLCFAKDWFDMCPINELKHRPTSGAYYIAIRKYHCVGFSDIDEKEIEEESYAYYPLAEIVLISIGSKYYGYKTIMRNLEEIGISLEELNISKINTKAIKNGTMVFKLLPKIVMHDLEMPDALSGGRIEGKQRVRIEIVSGTIAAPKIGCGGSGRHKNDAPLGVESGSGPGIGATANAPCIFGPAVHTELIGVWNRMEGPPHFTRVEVESANITRCGPFGFAHLRTQNQKILIDHPGSRRDQARPRTCT